MSDLVIRDLDRMPRPSDPYLWADYIELLCLFNQDLTMSRGDIESRLRHIAGEKSGLADELHPGIADRLNDKISKRLDDWFRHLEYRVHAFSTSYPFYIEGKELKCIEKKLLSLEQKLYLFLLLASNLRYVDDKTENKVSSVFEIVSLLALKSYMPSQSKVYLFGSNAIKNERWRYRGKLWNKLNALADDIGEMIVPKEDPFDPQNTGDGGLDLVGWALPGDTQPSFLLVFAQCACRNDEWVEKQHSSSASSWRPYINFTVPPINIAFIPFCFRQANGNWHHKYDIKESILMDRLRLIHLTRRKARSLRKLAFGIVDTVLEYSESTF